MEGACALAERFLDETDRIMQPWIELETALLQIGMVTPTGSSERARFTSQQPRRQDEDDEDEELEELESTSRNKFKGAGSALNRDFESKPKSKNIRSSRDDDDDSDFDL